MKSQRDSIAALRDLITRLEPGEVAHVRARLRKGGGQQGRQGCKVTTLFEELVARPCASSSDVILAVYGGSDDHGLKYLRLRLFSKILEIWAPVPTWPLRQPEAQAVGLVQLLACARMLWQRGGYVALEAVLSVIVHKAGSSEDYAALLEALQLWRRLLQFRMEATTAVDAQLAAANRAFQELQAVEALAEAEGFDLPHTVAPGLGAEVWRQWEGSSSYRVRFHCLSLQLYWLHRAAKAREALALARGMAAYVRQHAVLNSHPDYPALSQCHVAHAALANGLPQVALEALATAAFPADASPPLRWQAELLAAEALRMGQRPAAALEAYQRLLVATQGDPSPVRQSLRHHLAAGAALQAGLPTVALHLLEGRGRGFQSCPEWGAACRLLQVMACVDAGQFDAAELRIDALRKSLPSRSACPGLHERYSAVVKVLQSLVRSGFRFGDLREDQLSGLSLAGSTVGYPYAERISFVDWIRERRVSLSPVGIVSGSQGSLPPRSTARLEGLSPSQKAGGYR